MGQNTHPSRGTLYIVVCAAPPAQRIQDFVKLLQAEAWTLCVIATPQALKFIDAPLLEHLTGYSVRSEYKRPEDPDALPRADAIVVFPATFNTINKWVLGIADTLALGLLCEYVGLGKPILVVPHVTLHELGRHPAFLRSIATLKDWGISFLYDPEEAYPPANNVPPENVMKELYLVLGTTPLKQLCDWEIHR